MAMMPITLFDAQLLLMAGTKSPTVIDAGVQHGDTTEQYLRAFPDARVIGLEPDSKNYAGAQKRLAGFPNLELLALALSNSCGQATFRPVSHDGSHSLLEVENSPYFDSPVAALDPVPIETITVDEICSRRGIRTLDILKMDIQGGELLALNGAKEMLSRSAIRLVVLEVLFKPLYRNQPSFWDLAQFLRSYDYDLQGLYEPQHHARNAAILRWADAIFAAPSMQVLTPVRET